MEGLELSVQYTWNEDDGSYVFVLPCRERFRLPGTDVERSLPLRHMIELAATCDEATITFPSKVELSYFHSWAAALQPGAPVFRASAEDLGRAVKAAHFLADERSIERLASAYAKQLYPARAASVDGDFLRELEGMGEDLVRIVLAASSRPVGQRAWRLPRRLHPLDEAIAAVSSIHMHVQATAAAEAQLSEKEGQQVDVRQNANVWLLAAELSPDGRLIATCLRYMHAAVWHTGTGMLVRILQDSVPGDFSARCAAWSPDGTLLATGSRDGLITVWEVVTCAVKLRLSSPPTEVTTVAWSPNGLQICTGSGDGAARLWDVGTGGLLHKLSVHSELFGDVRAVAWSPDSAFVAGAPHDGTVKVWNAATGAVRHVLGGVPGGVQGGVLGGVRGGYGSPISSVAWSPDGSMLVTRTASLTAQVWDAATGTVKHTVEGSEVWAVAWSPDGRLLAIYSCARADTLIMWEVRLWEVATGTTTRILPVACRGQPRSVAWGPCGRFVFVAASEGFVYIYNVSDGQ